MPIVTEKETKPHLNEHVLALAASIEKQMELDAKTGVGKVSGDLYHDNLPEELTKETVQSVDKYNTSFVAAGTYAFGQIAVKAMKGHKDLSSANIEIPMGATNKLSIDVARSKEFSNHLAGSGSDTVTKYGSVTVNYEVRAGRNGGQLKTARAMVSELATAALKK